MIGTCIYVPNTRNNRESYNMVEHTKPWNLADTTTFLPYVDPDNTQTSKN